MKTVSGIENTELNDTDEKEELYLVFQIAKNYYAIPCGYLEYMYLLEKVAYVPGQPNYVRGVTNFKGDIVPIMDLRTFFGLQPLIDEYTAEVDPDTRIREHTAFVDTLCAEVAANRQVNLTNDPTKCNFGKWFYHFKKSNASMLSELGKIEEPHKAIHQAVDRVNRLMAEGRHGEAVKCVEDLRAHEFATTVAYLKEVHELLFKGFKELVVMVKTPEYDMLGIIIDQLIGTEQLAERLYTYENYDTRYISGVYGRDPLKIKEGQYPHVLLLDPKKLTE